MITKECVELIKKFESCVLHVYLDAVGVPTAGVGHTKGLTMAMVGMPITQGQADAWLKEDLAKFERKVAKYDSKYHWTQGEWGGLVSFAFNIGSIDGLTSNGTRTKEQIADAMLKYNKAGGRVLKGLTKRRQAEREMFLNGSTQHPTLKRGASGEAVKELQRLLGIKDDGIFGIATETSVKIYQKQHNLQIDGIVGRQTWDTLTK